MTLTPQRPPGPRGFDADALARCGELYADTLRAQLEQWQRSLDRLAAGRYGPSEVVRDLQESAARALELSAHLLTLWWPGPARPDSLVIPDPETPPAGPAGGAPEPAPPEKKASAARPKAPKKRRKKKPAPAPASPAPRRTGSAGRRADRLLTESLAGGERPSRQLLELAEAAGISESTLQRAKRRLGIESRREGFGPRSRVLWRLPEDA